MEKELVGLAGEYAVASELCKRGFYAQLTLGNHKKTDLLVETTHHLFRVSVKTKQGYSWPKVAGISEKGDLIVFVDIKGVSIDERPEFFVLNVAAWKKLAKSLQKTPRGKGSVLDETNTHTWKSWKGISIRKVDVEKYRDCWPAR